MSSYEQRIDRVKSLAETYLAEYDLDKAMDALCDVENTTPAELPDDLLVEAARRCLDQMDTMEFPGYSKVLRQVLFEYDLPGDDD